MPKNLSEVLIDELIKSMWCNIQGFDNSNASKVDSCRNGRNSRKKGYCSLLGPKYIISLHGIVLEILVQLQYASALSLYSYDRRVSLTFHAYHKLPNFENLNLD